MSMEKARVEKPWGSFTDYYHTDNKHIKLIEINDNARLSLQSHKHREEQWVVAEGRILVTVIPVKEFYQSRDHEILEEGGVITIRAGWIHRMQAINGPAKVLEIATGKFKETDIKRYEDDYQRKGTTKI